MSEHEGEIHAQKWRKKETVTENLLDYPRVTGIEHRQVSKSGSTDLGGGPNSIETPRA